MAVLALSVSAAGIAALLLSVGAAPHGGDCDNMAGECLRQRQGFAITGVEGLALVCAVTGAVCVVAAIRDKHITRNALALLATCGVVASAVLVIQPVDHLNNRFTGWLSDSQ